MDTSLEAGKPELRVIIDRDKAADLGVTVASIAEAINVLISGKVDITKYKDEAKGRLYDVRVRMNPQDRMSPGDVGQIYVRAKDGRLVELANVVKIQEGGAPSTITLRERGMPRREAILETGPVAAHSHDDFCHGFWYAAGGRGIGGGHGDPIPHGGSVNRRAYNIAFSDLDRRAGGL